MVRVLLWCRVGEADVEAVEAAYHQVSRTLSGTPGLLGNALLRSAVEPDVFAVMSEWESMDAFTAWEQGPSHRDSTAPLRTYQDRGRGRPYELLHTVASYS
ncbi:heme-degrading monooxygenase HmoA [Nonomuraea polychroma]|uniref:Heme-degrading monooxygenase HmoA n=1 Tax=Nonomuraea polychroma TaxID=46176 RepID=A0A438MEK8_9ACTN|nr:antibiotic biosynthesis monooxygenase [Nonomuraea polychroma]RVX44156.1 heme-degrading monooxygenase HmoA [Nonomuraea polychroma]